MAAAALQGASRMEAGPSGETWKYAVVVSMSANADPAWRAVADALAAKYAKAPFSSCVVVSDPAQAALQLREARPRYVAFVARPDEVGERTVYALHAMMKSLDGDPYYDAVWGIVTGPTADSALRVATAQPVHPRSALTTTGVGFGPFDAATTLSDGYAPGSRREDYARPDRPVAIIEKSGGGEARTRIVRGDTTAVFVDAWKALDPELLVTSSHASQRNLEMPFSTGNIVPRRGELWSLPDKRLIDYATGQAAANAASHAAAAPLEPPKRDKLWIAAGNCLIGDYKDNDSMAAAMIGYGRVVQFMGYVKTTWFGEIGWECLAQFLERRATVAESWYFAGQNLERKLGLMDKTKRGDTNLAGRIWDRDATMFWGDPALEANLAEAQARQQAVLTASKTADGVRLTFRALADIEAKEDKVEEVHVVHPYGIILPRCGAAYRVDGDTKGVAVMAADDFALVTAWPAMRKGDSVEILLRAPDLR